MQHVQILGFGSDSEPRKEPGVENSVLDVCRMFFLKSLIAGNGIFLIVRSGVLFSFNSHNTKAMIA